MLLRVPTVISEYWWIRATDDRTELIFIYSGKWFPRHQASRSAPFYQGKISSVLSPWYKQTEHLHAAYIWRYIGLDSAHDSHCNLINISGSSTSKENWRALPWMWMVLSLPCGLQSWVFSESWLLKTGVTSGSRGSLWDWNDLPVSECVIIQPQISWNHLLRLGSLCM